MCVLSLGLRGPRGGRCRILSRIDYSLWCFHEVLITAPERHLSVWNREEHRGSVSTSGDALEKVVTERETQTPPRGGGEGW